MKKKVISKYAYVQSWGSYEIQTLVSINLNHQEIIRFLEKKKCDEKFLNAFRNSEEKLAPSYESRGFYWKPNGAPGSVLWLRPWSGSWENIEVLIHELHHGVHFHLSQCRGMTDEIEALAYQQEYLFKKIRSELSFQLHHAQKNNKK